jgi:hypothetical protein
VVVESVNGGRSEGSAGRGDLNNKYGEHSTQRLGRAEEEARYYYYSPGVAARPPLYTARLRLTRPRPRTHVRTFALPTSTTTHTAKPPWSSCRTGWPQMVTLSRLSQLSRCWEGARRDSLLAARPRSRCSASAASFTLGLGREGCGREACVCGRSTVDFTSVSVC